MTPEERQELVRLLEHGEEVSPEWARVLFPPEKREYELVYYGKEREEDILANAMAVPLQPVRTFGKNGEGWHNMLIFGDNLQAMKSLLELKKAGKLCNSDGTPGARLMYIDPPFATRQEFRGTEDQKAYQDKITGARFLEFLRKRLVLMRELLADNGGLYVHLDTKKVHYVKTLLDELFGESNFRNEIIWKRQSAHSDTKQGSAHYGRLHDTILFYTRGPTFVWNPQFEEYENSYIETFYRHKDVDGRAYRLSDLTAPKPGGDTLYEWRVKQSEVNGTWVADLDDEYKNPKRGWKYKGVTPYRGRFWAYSKVNMVEFARQGRLLHNRELEERYGSWPGMERHLQLPDKLACSIDQATGTGKSYVLYGLAATLLAKGAVDRVLVLCPSNTIEAGLLAKFKELAANSDLRDLLPADARVRTPRIINASETIVEASICVENYHAILENVKSSIRDSLKGKGERVAVLNDEAHHIANESGAAAKRWKEFLLDPAYGFRFVVGVSGTCYVGDDYFADVVSRYSLRQAIEERWVKKVEYVAEMPETDNPEEKWQLVFNRHQDWKKGLKKRRIRPLTIVVTKGIADCKRVAEELEGFLQDWEGITAEQAKAKVLPVTSAREHQPNVARLP